MTSVTTIEATAGYSLAETCAPVHWGGGRWPGQDWIDGRLTWVGQDDHGVIVRDVPQPDPGEPVVVVHSNRPMGDDFVWAGSVLGTNQAPPAVLDPVVR